jgi:anti-sigma factor RsiW
MTMEDHIPEDELQGFVDSRLGDERTLAVATHIKECPECLHSLEVIRRLDSALHRAVLERTGAAFSVSVMHRLGLAASSNRFPSFFAHVASLFAMLVVLGVLVSVFLWTGVIDSAQLVEGQSFGHDVLTKGGAAVSDTVSWFNGWLKTYFPFAFGKGSLDVSLSVALAVVVLALIDRAASRRLSQKMR